MSLSSVPGIPSRRSRVAMRREATADVEYQYCAFASVVFCHICSPLHLNPSCNRKNSLNAASSLNTPRPLASAIPSPPFLGERAGALDRQICANKPSICRRPLRILVASTEEMLSNASERRDSMAGGGDQVCLDGKSERWMGICRPLSAEDGYLVNVGVVAAKRLGSCG